MRLLPRPLSLSLAALAALPLGCGGGDDDVTDEDIILLDETSDEVVLTLQEEVDRGMATVDDEVAAHLTAPADGAELAADQAPTLTWSPRQSDLRHGRDTGEYVWIHIECPGMAEPIDLAAIEAMSWPVDEERWELLRSSTGSCEVQVVSAYVDRGIVTEGPFVPSTNPSFTVGE